MNAVIGAEAEMKDEHAFIKSSMKYKVSQQFVGFFSWIDMLAII
jgi:hypothetical protein